MPAPVGTQIRLIAWGFPGMESINLASFRLQKGTTADGPFFDLAGMPAAILDANQNFITAFQDNQSDDNFWYRISFIDVDGRETIFTEPGQPGLFSLRSALLDRIRLRLGDDDPSRKQLDNNIMFTWDRLKLSAWLDEAVMEFNAAPPTQFAFTLETAPNDVLNIMLTFVEAKALRERSTIDNANQMNYSDGISLNIQRAEFYLRRGDKMKEEALAAAANWKKINRARARGLAYQRLPFKVLRPLSFGPNAVNLFST